MSAEFPNRDNPSTPSFNPDVTHSSQSFINGETATEESEISEDEKAVELEDKRPVTKPPSVEELKKQEADIQRQIAERQKIEKDAVIQQIVDVSTQYNVTIEDLIEAMGGFKPKRKGVKATPKYRDPVTGTTWSGRGKEPTWMRGLERDDFLIKED